METEFIVYTDGASRKDGRGGWGWHLVCEAGEFNMCGGEYGTTNNRMELMAAINALREIESAVDPDERVTIQLWSDSQYLIKGITEYVEDWKFRRWRTSANDPIANVDLWLELDRFNTEFEIDWRWVRGHTGNPGNEKADALATRGVPPAKAEQAADTRPGFAKVRRRPTGSVYPYREGSSR